MRYEFGLRTCNMCGSADFRLLGMRLSASQGRNPRQAEGIAVPVKRCRTCGLVFSDPQPVPQSLSDHYGLPPEDYWGEALAWTPGYFAQQIDAAKRLIGFTPGMTALDIGAGVGLAMGVPVGGGCDSWGLEPSEPFRRKAIDVTGIDPDRIQLAGIEDAEYSPGSFDFITFGAVLEHLYDPHAALSKAMSWLKPGGVTQAEVPSSDWLIPKLVNFYFRLRGTNYVTHISPMHPPFHLYEFTLKSFRHYEVAEHRLDVCTITHVPGSCTPYFASG
jgi:SAM-dependent methyltransferase